MLNLQTRLSALQKKSPLIHCISNSVTANDCANCLLAVGASPIMADAIDEAAEITKQCSALCINFGTPNSTKLQAILASGKAANQKGIPIVLDPVGVGASSFRVEAVRLLLSELHISLIRGNLSEIRTIAELTPMALPIDLTPIPMPIRGVDTALIATDDDLLDTVALAMRLSAALSVGSGSFGDHTVIVISGETDIVTSPQNAAVLRSGSEYMSRVTGMGCISSCLCAAFLASDSKAPFSSAVSAVAAMNVCGECAEMRMSAGDGCGLYRTYFMDAVSSLTPEILQKQAKLTLYESRDIL